MKQESIRLAYRDKDREKLSTSNIKAGIQGLLFLSILSLILAIILVFIPAEEGDKGYKIGLIAFLIGGAGFLSGVVIPLCKQKKKIDLQNNYPLLAIYFENGNICINNDTVITIPISNISTVQRVDENVETNELSKIIIIDNENNEYVVENLTESSSKSAYKSINAFLNGQYFKVKDVYYLYNNFYQDYSAEVKDSELFFEINVFGKHEKLDVSIKTVETIFEDFEGFYNKVLNSSIKEVMSLAMNSQQNGALDEKEVLTKMKENLTTIFIGGEDYIFDFDLYDIFGEHVVSCSGKINEDTCIVNLEG